MARPDRNPFAEAAMPPQALVPVAPPQDRRAPLRRWGLALVLLLLAGAGAGGGWYWWQLRQAGTLPAGIVAGNGRIEAEPVEVASKLPGRLAELLVDEGAMVHAGQVLGRLDAREAEAALNRARAQLGQAERALEGRHAVLGQQQSQLRLAEAELGRSQALVDRGYATRQTLDQRRSAREVAAAGLRNAQAQVAEGEQAIQAATEEARRLEAHLSDSVLTAPIDGRVQYRLANPGEVLGAGGRVLTLLDVTNVYMAVFLPTAQAGRAAIGTEGRIVLDAYPNIAILAHVSFLSPEAQFTPKAVETRSERDRLVFRVKLRIDAELLRAHAAEVRTGLPGTGYLRLDPGVAWPAWLATTAR